jgi:MFS family permease
LTTVYSILNLKRVSVMAEAGQRDVHDAHARRCWAGAGDRLILGYSRAWIAVAACAAALAVGGAQYGFGAFDLRLATTQHWGPLAVGCSLTAWIACQSAASGALPWCRRFGVSPAKAATFGAACCALGLLLTSRTANPVGALAVYAVTAGTGAGLVYGTSVAVVTGWFPDKRLPAALASGSFGLGTVASAVLAVATARDPAPPFSVLAWVIVTVAALCAPLLRDAPRRWWPSGVVAQRIPSKKLPLRRSR